MKALSLIPILGLAALLAAPADAGHRHGRGCGHVYSRPYGGWISIDVYGRHGGFSYKRYRGRDRRYGYDPYSYYGRRGRYRYRWKELKRREKFYRKRYRRNRHRGHYDYGRYCPRY